ncbi:ABC transporter ATP-binding protein [Clostridium aminobutyricum]|uniref:ABC transporter ATP-binding protein n=1 Tax=Clostridium aminobutyricum TaxID=33953 RepID=A0A939DAG1_CLOAM|nr:ABC transporter ATP-binding protein [Clostridium aminobutyricum]MBN7774369.1 ABC transporter ATP-binding protein [Clostridium aminobutyricum]
MKQILSYYKPHIPTIFLILILLFCQAMSELALPGFMSDLIDHGILRQDLSHIYSTGVKMMGITLFLTLCSIGVSFLAARTAAKTSRVIRSELFSKITSFSKVELDKFSTASLITRSTNDMQQVQTATIIILRIAFFVPIMGVGALIKAISTSVELSWTIALAITAMFLLMLFAFKVTLPKFAVMQKMIDKLNLIMNERLTGTLVIRAFNAEHREERRFDQANRDLTELNLFVNRAMSVMMPLMFLIMNFTAILVVWAGAGLVDTANLQIGDVIAFIQYSMQVIMSFLFISILFIMIPRAIVSANRVGEVLAVDPQITDAENPVFLSVTGEIEFKNVSFKYPDAEDDVLKNISFIAKPGQMTAFIGSTGSGKSTLVNLIPRFYDVTEGRILIDGMDVRSISQKHLRQSIGYVPQKGILFSGTIESNLRFGAGEASQHDLEHAASIAQALHFINEKPTGFEEPIAQGGINVSGGQKQRLSIARALTKKAPIYIFDDSFSALDFKTDAALRKALHKNMSQSTILVVAQRINTIKDAEQIIVLNEGEIAGIGTHKQLLESCQVYREIAESQLDKEEL